MKKLDVTKVLYIAALSLCTLACIPILVTFAIFGTIASVLSSVFVKETAIEVLRRYFSLIGLFVNDYVHHYWTGVFAK